jgi:hypothetical protein
MLVIGDWLSTLMPLPFQSMKNQVQYADEHSVTNAANSAGGSASDYGNGIKDATKASGPRTQTAQNPLGTSNNSFGGKKVVSGTTSTGNSSGSKGTASNPLGLS